MFIWRNAILLSSLFVSVIHFEFYFRILLFSTLLLKFYIHSHIQNYLLL